MEEQIFFIYGKTRSDKKWIRIWCIQHLREDFVRYCDNLWRGGGKVLFTIEGKAREDLEELKEGIRNEFKRRGWKIPKGLQRELGIE